MNEDVPVTVAQPRRWRWVTLAGFALVLLLGFGFLVWLVVSYVANAELQSLLAEMDQRDPGWRLEELAARRTRPPDEQNAAVAIATAHRLLPAGWPVPQLDDALQGLETPEQLNEQQIALLRRELQRADGAVREARRLADLDQAYFGVSWDQNWVNAAMPAVQEARVVASLLRYDMMLRAQEKDLDGALLSARAVLRAGRVATEHPMLISMLVRLALRAITLRQLERVLAQGEPSPEALAQFQRLLEEELADPLLLNVARGERAYQHMVMTGLRSGTMPANAVLPPGDLLSHPILLKFVAPLVGGGLLKNHVALLRTANSFVELARLPSAEQPAQLQQLIAGMTKGPMMVRLLAPAYDKLLQAYNRSQAEVGCALLIIAIERFRQAQGRWPESLTELVPAYVAAVPTDPFGQGPLLYRATKNGVVVYAVGADGEDNGGDPLDATALKPGTDFGYRLWNVESRRQPPPPPRPITLPEDLDEGK